MELLTIAGFNRLFEQHLPHHPTHQAAYEAAEKEFHEQHNHNRYSNFESFKRARLRWLKSNFCRSNTVVKFSK